MSEWLTTGEMIDRLKVGEVAESEQGCKLTKTNHGQIFRVDVEASGYFTPPLNHSFIKDRWRILPKYVSFEEAMKAFVGGIKVRAELSDPEEIYEYQLIDGVFHYRNIKRGDDQLYRASETSGIGIRGPLIAKGKWTIEDDSND